MTQNIKILLLVIGYYPFGLTSLSELSLKKIDSHIDVRSALDHISLPPEFESRRGHICRCFIFHFASLPSEVARPIQPTMCTKVVVKHQSSSSSSYHTLTFASVPLVSQRKSGGIFLKCLFTNVHVTSIMRVIYNYLENVACHSVPSVTSDSDVSIINIKCAKCTEHGYSFL